MSGQQLPLRGGIDEEQGLAVFNRFCAFHQDFGDTAVYLGFDFIHEFHGFHDAQDLTFLDEILLFDIGIGFGGSRPKKCPDDRFNLD